MSFLLFPRRLEKKQLGPDSRLTIHQRRGLGLSSITAKDAKDAKALAAETPLGKQIE